MDYVGLFKKEIIPAFGCTEPIALSYVAAEAVANLGNFPEKIEAKCSGNIIKNVKSVVIPNSGGKKGLVYAIVLGAIIGKPDKKLEILESATDEDRELMNRLGEGDFCKVSLAEGVANLYVEILATYKDEYVKVRLEDAHTNITYIEKNNQVLLEKPPVLTEEMVQDQMCFDEIYDFAKNADYTELKDILDKEIEYNQKISDEGLKNNYGANIGKLILDANGIDNIEALCKVRAAAGSDARMSGCALPVYINSGSGNQGITVSLPVITFAEYLKSSKDELYRALIFANLIGLYQKAGIGKLSAYCGAISASVAGVSGVAFLKGEDKEIIAQTIVNGLASLSGIVCDGAKPSCAGKIAIGLDGAFMGYRQAKSNNSYKEGDGLVATNVDDTIRRIGIVAKEGMKETDIVILNEMIRA